MAGVALLLAVTLWVTTAHLQAIVVPQECWAEWLGDEGAATGCRGPVSAWLDVNEHEVGRLTGILTFLPVVLGAILGVPIVAREAEMRTLGLAWSLEGRRSRWLLVRAMPMLLLAVVAAVILGFAASSMREAQLASPFETPWIDDLARQGPVLASRVLLGLAIGAFVGAVVGRTLPGLAIAGVLLVVWVGFVGPAIEDSAKRTHAEWVPYSVLESSSDLDPNQPLGHVMDGYRIPDGTIVIGSVWDLCVQDVDGNCQEPWPPAGHEALAFVVPQRAWHDIERVEVIATLLAAGIAGLLTFPVVARRRPE